MNLEPDAPTIVVVDDAAEVRLLLRTRLRLSGRFRVVGEGADGRDAVALAAEHRPALMLLDVSMPGMDGLEALPRVLSTSPDTLVALYSGFEEQGLVDKALELGAAAFLEKSTPVDEVMDRLAALHAALPAPAGRSQVAEPSGTDVPGLPSLDETVLEEHLERFREVFVEAAIGMATMTLTGTVVRANRAMAAVLQRSVDDLVGASYGDLSGGEGDRVAAVLEDIRAHQVDVVRLEHGVSGPAGDRRVVATFAPVRDSIGRALYVFLQVQDVTAERAAVEDLRRSEERFRLLVENVRDYAIFMLDTSGRVASWNAGAQRFQGYTAQEIIGRHFRVFYPPEVQEAQHPEHELELALRDGSYAEEGWRVRKDGTRFWASVLITAIHNAAGEHVGFAKVTRDNTDRRRLELEREHAVEALAAANAELGSLNARLQQSADDQAQFLAVTAHELRTPIGVLGGSAEMLSRHWADLEEGERAELLEAMGASTARLRRLLDDLLTASRLQASKLQVRTERVPVRDVVEDAVATARRARPDAQVVAEVPDGLVVTGDRDRLAQALDNLLGNALRHGRPPVRVAVTAVADEVRIRVSDQGPGVSEEMRPRLFDRFATGASKGGTGLGLFIVRELVRAHGGDAVYEAGSPAEPSGAFVLTLPRTAGERVDGV